MLFNPCRLDLRTRTSTRFNLKVFVRVLKKKHPGKFQFTFFTKKVSTVICTILILIYISLSPLPIAK